MARTNGGIIGVVNKSSFGKNTVSSQTSDGNICTQAGTTLIDATVVAGGPAGGVNGNSGGGGGAGGFRTNFPSWIKSFKSFIEHLPCWSIKISIVCIWK